MNIGNVTHFGSYVTSDCFMKEELSSRIQMTVRVFGRLREGVFYSHSLTVLAKIVVYNQCLIHVLMNETWTFRILFVCRYQNDIHTQLRYLRLILNVK